MQEAGQRQQERDQLGCFPSPLSCLRQLGIPVSAWGRCLRLRGTHGLPLSCGVCAGGCDLSTPEMIYQMTWCQGEVCEGLWVEVGRKVFVPEGRQVGVVLKLG